MKILLASAAPLLSGYGALVVLAGVPMFSLNKFMAFDPLRTQRVAVFTKRYFYGSGECEGLLSFTTHQGNRQGFALDPRALLKEYESVQGAREFFAPATSPRTAQLAARPPQPAALAAQPRAGPGANLLHFRPSGPLPRGGARPSRRWPGRQHAGNL